MPNPACPKCGTEAQPGTGFCASCGTGLQGAPPPVPTAPGAMRAIGLGEICIFVGSFLFFVFSLIYLVKYFDLDGKFNLFSIGVIVLMLSPAGPFVATFLSLKNPSLLRINYVYAAFIWLLQIGGVTVLQGAGRMLSGFFVGVDFWMLLAATTIAAGTYLAEHPCKGNA